ncbi:hypothetical protein CMV_001091 [Castanea mollissima]|uniref:Uncharacterized protein n=1 Tax=Castanea mollissima TaxID=60419 RepID=A0A8J4RS63_9ROSI|nr:hypothetical protein CMV_001091 [Castanea mollissima]
MKPVSLFSQGSSQRTQGAPEVDAAMVGDSPHNQGGAKNKGKTNIGIPNKDVSSSYASVVVGNQKNTTGGGVEGKKKSALGGVKILSECSRNTCKKSVLGQREHVGEKLVSDLSCVYCESCKASTLGQRELLGAKVLSTLKVIESDGMKSELSLDLFMLLECGLDGNWAIVWSEVNEVGPYSLNPSKPIIHNSIPSSPIVPSKPKKVWRPRQTPIMLNPAHCQSSKPDLVAHALGSRLQKPMEVQLPRVGQEGSSSRSEESRSVTACSDDPVTGKALEASCSTDKAIIDAGKDSFGFSSPCTEVPHGLGIWDLGVTGDLMVGSNLVGSGPVMRNGFFPPLDLGNVLEVEFGEGETHVEDVDSVGALQSESGLLILPWKSSGVVDSGCGSGKKDNWIEGENLGVEATGAGVFLKVSSLFVKIHRWVLIRMSLNCKLSGFDDRLPNWSKLKKAKEPLHGLIVSENGEERYADFKNNRLNNYTFSFDQMLNDKVPLPFTGIVRDFFFGDYPGSLIILGDEAQLVNLLKSNVV